MIRRLSVAAPAVAVAAAAIALRGTIGAAAVVVLLGACVSFALLWLTTQGRLESLRDERRRDALTDPLTALPNRHALMDELNLRTSAVSDQRLLVLAVYDLDGFKAYNDEHGHLAGDELLVRLAERLSAAIGPQGRAFRLGGNEFCALIPTDRAGAELVRRRAHEALAQRDEADEIHGSCGTVLMPIEAPGVQRALRLADRRMHAEKESARNPSSRESADVLLKVLSERDGDLGHHIGDVAVLAQATAQRLGLPDNDVRRVRLAAELHDVGKSAIPDAILNKPDTLDENEWEFMRAHTIIGERIIRAAPSLADVAELVRASHERVDATGYPDGLRGEAIPLGARIIAVCDACDAMISPRPYREPVTVTEALQELRRCRGSQFDARIVDTFCALVEAPEGRGIAGLAA